MNGFAMRLHSWLRLAGRPIAPKMPNLGPRPAVQPASSPRVVGDIYTTPLICTATLPKHTKTSDAVLPVAAAGGPFQMPLFMLQSSGQTSRKPQRTRAVSGSDIDNVLSPRLALLVLDRVLLLHRVVLRAVVC